MGYSKTVFFIPLWFDDYKDFSSKTASCTLWNKTEKAKINPGYLFHYAANIANDSKLFESYTLKAPNELNLYMYEGEVNYSIHPSLEEVRLSLFATGIGFMEFWVSYTDMSVEDIADFAYLFKKAKKRSGKPLPDNKRALYDVAMSLLPQNSNSKLFFSSSAEYKFECNCLHFIHKDEEIPEEGALKSALCRLSRSYKKTMPVGNEGAYDMTYEANTGDYWGGSTEGLVNLVYDPKNNESDPSHLYLHTIKPLHLTENYYFMYLLLLNQKYSALQYIFMVSKVIDRPSKEIENLNKRIIQLKNVFSFNIISDDLHFQNIYSKMFSILEIKNLLADVIENENQTEFLQNAKHANADRLSNKYLFGISILSLFSALIDAATYFDRIDGIKAVSTSLSLVCVSSILILCIVWAIKSINK